MARVHLVSTIDTTREDPYWSEYHRMQRLVVRDRFGVHHLADDPDSADLIIFLKSHQTYQLDVAVHRLLRRYGEKVFLFDSSDRVWPFVPGVYASLRKRNHRPDRTRGGFFPQVCEADYLVPTPVPATGGLLYSFVGSFDTSPLRPRLAALADATSHIEDTSRAAGRGYGQVAEIYREYRARYARILQDSRFVLSPEGVGASSIRLFEAMRAGRAPVIISDDWVPPDGPDWSSCSLQIPESELHALPRLLRERAPEAAVMGARAREEWESWFSGEVAFHRIVEWCLDIRRSRRWPDRLLRLSTLPQVIDRDFLRATLRFARKRLLAAR